MKTIEDGDGKILKIADSLEEFNSDRAEAFDGYLTKFKKSVKMFIGDKKYVINKWGVICKESISNGAPYYQHGVLDFGYMSQNDFVSEIATSKKYIRDEVDHTFL